MSSPRKTPSQQRSRFTYNTILEAAARVFDREGPSATTNRIAGEAGVSVGSLYQYFPNKHALLHELTLRHIDHAHVAFADALDRIQTSRPSLDAVIAELVELAVEENGPLVGMHRLVREHAPRTPEIENRFRRFVGMLVDRLATYAERPGEDGDALRLRLLLAVAALDGQIHSIVLDATTADERHARTQLAIQQTIRAIRE